VDGVEKGENRGVLTFIKNCRLHPHLGSLGLERLHSPGEGKSKRGGRYSYLRRKRRGGAAISQKTFVTKRTRLRRGKRSNPQKSQNCFGEKTVKVRLDG